MEYAVQANYTISFDVTVVMGMFKTVISVLSNNDDCSSAIAIVV